ncbi:MAG: NUDIX hydrolase [Rhodocyclaceae bacterium]|jgi:ADP-ribose pyrophosphatase
MSDHHLKEETLESRPVFQGSLVKVWSDRVRLPNGEEAGREYIRHPGAVAVIARLGNGNLLFERQYRHPLGRVMLELPAGKIDPGEDLLACAQRELREETGYLARRWRLLGTIHPCIGYSDEHIDFFLADDLHLVGSALDEGEFIELVEMSLEEAIAAVLDGRITDGKTVAGLFWVSQVLGSNPPPRSVR